MVTGRSTLKDVAELAGVSRTTASTALGSQGRVSAATQARVRAAAEQLGYTADVIATRLRKKSFSSIGLYIPLPVLEVSFHMQFTLGAAMAARSSHVDLTLLAYDDAESLQRVPGVDGIMIVEAMRDDPVIDRLVGLGLPTLFVGPQPGGRNDLPEIAVDHEGVMLQVLDHLGSLGCKRPGLLGPAREFGSDWSEAILRGYRTWCTANGVEPAHFPAPVLPNAGVVEEGIRQLVSEGVDGLIGAHEGSAALALSSLQRLGLTVGPKFPVVSLVGSASDEHTLPPLTAVDLRPFAFGQKAASLLIGLGLDGSSVNPRTKHAADLILRESTVGKPLQ